MIQPNELRLLNWVKLNDEDLFCKVLVIDNFGLSVDIVKTKEITWIEYEQFSPVELTPDILEAAGWYWNNEADCYEHSDVRMSMNHNSISGWTMFNYVLKAKITNKIFYLHQLQNLYFALTGEELQIDITKLNKEK